jgi:putative membrane protein
VAHLGLDTMANKELPQQTQNSILILCVDRDGDIEVKAGIKTPLLGRVANLDAAVALALKDPEEPDANAMFEAVRLYDRLLSEKKPGETFEVATISGTELGGVTADRKLVGELTSLLETFTATEVILVSDGYSDEAVLPLIESRVPVSSVRRIVIKHSESIEETAAVFTKYMKLLVDNPRYSRLALGLPGLLVLIFGIFWALNVFAGIPIYYYGIAIVVIVGGFLLLKGFGVDRAAKNVFTWVREYSPPPLPMQISNYTILAGILCIAVSVYLGIQNVVVNMPPTPVDNTFAGWVGLLPSITASFIKGIMDLMIVGAILVLVGRSLRLYFERDPRLLRTVALIVEVAWARMILDSTASLLQQTQTVPIGFQNVFFTNFIWAIVVGILIGIASILLITIINRSSKGFFKKSEEEEDKQKEVISKTPSDDSNL